MADGSNAPNPSEGTSPASEGTSPAESIIEAQPDHDDPSASLGPIRDAIAIITDHLEAAKSAAGAAAATKDAAQALLVNVQDLQRSMSTLLTDAQAQKAEIAAITTFATAARTQLTDEQAVIATKSTHIQGAQEHADKVRADLDRQLTAATQQVTEAEGLKARAQSAADTTSNLLAEVRTAKGQADNDLTTIATAVQTADDSAERTSSLAAKALTIEERLGTYEERLATLDAQCTEQLKTIESLLPGATSAGLAHSFDERRKTFQRPQTGWQRIFFWSLVLLIVLAGSGLYQVYHLAQAPSYDEVIRLWLSRLPVGAALVWLALHASRESALAKRLEEDYGYKAVIASSFEGFRKQMAEITSGVSTDLPVGKLAANTLTTIASPPGRIYEKHPLVVSPAGEIGKAARSAADAVTTLKPSL